MISGTSCFHLFGANLLQLFSPLRKFRSQCRAQNFPLNSGGWEESLQALQQVDGFSKGLEFEMTLKILFFLSFEKKQKTTGVVSTNAFVFFLHPVGNCTDMLICFGVLSYFFSALTVDIHHGYENLTQLLPLISKKCGSLILLCSKSFKSFKLEQHILG